MKGNLNVLYLENTLRVLRSGIVKNALFLFFSRELEGSAHGALLGRLDRRFTHEIKVWL